jgi:hypothetical protein
MHQDIKDYNNSQSSSDREICELLGTEITKKLSNATNKVWHAHPVWFLDGNPIVGYSKMKTGIKLMFWSGVGFDEKGLVPGTGKFKDASITYTNVDQVNVEDLHRWLEKGSKIQWDYANIVKRKGKLIRLK